MNKKIKLEIPFFQCPNDIFEIQELNSNEKLTYVYLCRCANNGSIAFPSFATIGTKCGFSSKTAQRTIKKLIEFGLVKKVNRKKINKQNKETSSMDSNIYEVNMPERLCCKNI